MRYALIFLALPMVACEPEYEVNPPDDEADVHLLTDVRADFANASEEQLARALEVADGTLVDRLVEMAQQADLDHLQTSRRPDRWPDGMWDAKATCPKLVVWGHLGWYHGDGCTGLAYNRYWGDLFVVNALRTGLDAYADEAAGDFEPNEPAQFVFVEWEASRLMWADQVVDGTLRWSEADRMGAWTESYDVRIDESTLLGDEAASLAADVDCERARSSAEVCRYVDGSEGWLSGLGRFEISGIRRLEDGTLYGMVELSGESTVRFEMDAALYGCVPYDVLGGDSGQICN